jgi:hypothetical protein
MGFSRLPWFVGLKNFLDTLVFWKTTQFHALAARQTLASIPGLSRSSHVPLRDNYTLVHVLNGASDHFIFIYSLNRC